MLYQYYYLNHRYQPQSTPETSVDGWPLVSLIVNAAYFKACMKLQGQDGMVQELVWLLPATLFANQYELDFCERYIFCFVFFTIHLVSCCYLQSVFILHYEADFIMLGLKLPCYPLSIIDIYCRKCVHHAHLLQPQYFVVR